MPTCFYKVKAAISVQVPSKMTDSRQEARQMASHVLGLSGDEPLIRDIEKLDGHLTKVVAAESPLPVPLRTLSSPLRKEVQSPRETPQSPPLMTEAVVQTDIHEKELKNIIRDQEEVITNLRKMLEDEQECHDASQERVKILEEECERLQTTVVLSESALVQSEKQLQIQTHKAQDLCEQICVYDGLNKEVMAREQEAQALVREAQRQLAVACSELERIHSITPSQSQIADLGTLRISASTAQETYNAALQELHEVRHTDIPF
eukprot:TRINITY_DN20070_c0_g1_i1.p1 TRINITY_DN20070_c0_g1~~TRINITY_DN20070_c0_g1_i1.p1  ORF type:complete len:263 (+),score=50.23 TRINITY_DN20070_c0_g1_i1:63-851(+)